MVQLGLDTQCSGGCTVSYMDHLTIKSLNFCTTFSVFPTCDQEKSYNMNFLETEFVVKINSSKKVKGVMQLSYFLL